MVILILFAALSGLVTVLSPCILPILPVVLSSSANRGKARPLGMIAGLILSFSIFTLVVSRLVALLGVPAGVLRLAAVVIIGLLGLSMLVPALSAWVEKGFRFLPGLVPQKTLPGSGFGPGFLTGASLGLVWAPCAGPILAAVTTLVAIQRLSFEVVLVILAYALGSGIPLLAIAYGGRALINRIPFLTRHLLRVQQTFGIVMVLTAGLIAFNVDTLVTTWVTGLVPPGWTATLDSFESSPAVSQQLSQLKPTQAAQPTPTAQPAAIAGASSQPKRDLPDLGAAPELTGINHWINSAPLTLKGLKGKVVLVDFWTYSCINCIRTLPYVTDWYSKYKDKGFVVIGVHTPEFEFEHDTSNVEEAVKRFKITYPVAQDNNYATWQAFNNMYWPAEYLIDAQGNVREENFGEGNYDQTEKSIQQLLAEAGHVANTALTQGAPASASDMQTPETYIGLSKRTNFAYTAGPSQIDIMASYSIPHTMPLNFWSISGEWTFQPEFAKAMIQGDEIELHFYARDVYLVMTSDQPVTAKVTLIHPIETNLSEDVNAQGVLTVKESRLYHLVRLKEAADGMVLVEFGQPGVELFAFTFGG